MTNTAPSTTPSTVPAIVRTIVPSVVGVAASIAVKQGWAIPNAELTGVITIATTAAYYSAVRGLEEINTRFGWLLGYASRPAYAAIERHPKVAATTLADVEATLAALTAKLDAQANAAVVAGERAQAFPTATVTQGTAGEAMPTQPGVTPA